jgi:hypothetical protein
VLDFDQNPDAFVMEADFFPMKKVFYGFPKQAKMD